MIAAGDLAVYRRGRTPSKIELHPAEVIEAAAERCVIWWRDKTGRLHVSRVKTEKLERIGGGF